MTKHQTRKLSDRGSYDSNLPGEAEKVSFIPPADTFTSGTHPSSSTFPTSSINISSVSAPFFPSLTDSHRQVKRSKSILADKTIQPQNNECTNKFNKNVNDVNRTNIRIENKHCSNDRVRRLLLRRLETAPYTTSERNTPDFSALGSNPNPFGYSDDLSLYRRNPKLQDSRKTHETRIPEKKKESNFKKSRKRLSKLLHTHAALILLSVLVVMDATCVIGQLLADIFIVKAYLGRTEIENEDIARKLQSIFPNVLNRTDQLSLEEKLNHLKETLEGETLIDNLSRYINRHVNRDGASGQTPLDSTKKGSRSAKQIAKKLSLNSTNVEIKSENASPNPTADVPNSRQDELLLAWRQLTKALNEGENILRLVKGFKDANPESTEEPSENDSQSKSKDSSNSKKSSSRKTGNHEEEQSEEEHILLEVTHVFHMTSLSILSILLLETLLKVFAMGKKVWNHKLEVFDAAVIIISWSLDLVFKDGIWDHPGSNAATILIILLPWRVVRIVNSFVLVIQEKDNVRLKLLKHRYRSSERRTRECKDKLNKYRVETQSLQGVCRKFGVPEGQIIACMPIDKRRRGNLALTALSEFASLAMVGSVGSLPNLGTKSEYSSDSSSSDDDELREQHRGIDRTVSADSAFSQTNSIFSTVSFAVDCRDNLGEDNIAYTDETMDNTGSLPTYEDAMISVINSNSEVVHAQNHHTKL